MDPFRPVIKRPSVVQSDLQIRRQRRNFGTLTQIALPFPTFHLEFLVSETCKQTFTLMQADPPTPLTAWKNNCDWNPVYALLNYFWLLENLTLVGRGEDLSACIRGRVVQWVFAASLLDRKSKITFTDTLVIRVCVQSFH